MISCARRVKLVHSWYLNSELCWLLLLSKTLRLIDEKVKFYYAIRPWIIAHTYRLPVQGNLNVFTRRNKFTLKETTQPAVVRKKAEKAPIIILMLMSESVTKEFMMKRILFMADRLEPSDGSSGLEDDARGKNNPMKGFLSSSFYFTLDVPFSVDNNKSHEMLK